MFSESLISKIREIQLMEALDLIGATWKVDSTYRPNRDKTTKLLLVENKKIHFEMVVTEPKFVLRRRGERKPYAAGGGAIDLAMALTNCDFRSAVRLLAGEQ